MVNGVFNRPLTLFNAVLWDGKRFQRYVMGPSSLNGHHNGLTGNFRHSVEVAERALSISRDHDTTFAPLLILGGLLHDAGKADEYRFDYRRRAFAMSERGALVGHRHTVLEWIPPTLKLVAQDLLQSELDEFALFLQDIEKGFGDRR